MAKLTVRQKAARVLQMLLGVCNPRVLEALMSRGFQEEDLEDGWRRLRALGKVKFVARNPRAVAPNELQSLDKWENTWFPVADATLRHRFPKVHELVFLNVAQTKGAAVIISVQLFVERVAALREGDAQSRTAAKLLSVRGITDPVLDEARSLLAQLRRPAEEGRGVDFDARRKETLAAEAELWAWYLEWSQIARGVIPDRRLLRELGLLRSARDGESDDTIDGDDRQDQDETKMSSPGAGLPEVSAPTLDPLRTNVPAARAKKGRRTAKRNRRRVKGRG
jgi:hypothetical protein